jgi:hypothetical protein
MYKREDDLKRPSILPLLILYLRDTFITASVRRCSDLRMNLIPSGYSWRETENVPLKCWYLTSPFVYVSMSQKRISHNQLYLSLLRDLEQPFRPVGQHQALLKNMNVKTLLFLWKRNAFQWLRLALPKQPNRGGVPPFPPPLFSPEDGSRTIFQNVVILVAYAPFSSKRAAWPQIPKLFILGI